MRRVLSLLLLAAACGGSALPDRVAVLGVDRLSGALAGQEVELPGTDLAAVRGPAAMIMLGSSTDTARVPDCAMRRRVSGALVARTVSCVSLLGHYAAMERARQFLLAAGAEALLPAPVLASSTAEPGLHYDARTDTFTLGEGPEGARVPLALNPGAVTREMARRQLRAVASAHPEEAEGIALFLGAAAAAGDPGYLAASQPGGDPTGQLDLSRPLPVDVPASAALAAALWAWADASGDLTGASRAALAAARALGPSASDPAAVLSLVAAQFEGAERDQACAVFRARLHAAGIPACP
ncbi:MAG: hypothetical protein AUG04_13465 [Deltaproteobacteria bacterium 13_1_20CM_2_69_21]|nr:MAG: hypothetical protein AUH83_05385 [Deltaproteobacteria bacterium 13_1_40CM_4_68_19]OLE61730.1 MAG: hypothetical protein AUG04_13465 [Deltaproteobacteria bacterium 13_1_20CM_2_69_21]